MASRSSLALGIVAVAAIIAAVRTGGLDFAGGPIAAIVLAAFVGGLTFAPGRPRTPDPGRARRAVGDAAATEPVSAPAATPGPRVDAPEPPDTGSAGIPRWRETPVHGTVVGLAPRQVPASDARPMVPASLDLFEERRVRDRRATVRRPSSPATDRPAKGMFGPRDEWSLEDSGEARALRRASATDGFEQAGRRGQPTGETTVARRPARGTPTQGNPLVAAADRFVHERRTTRDLSTLGAEVRGAVERGELELQYQPVIDFRTGAAVGFEALVRWRHPDHGIVWPDEFIPAAEQVGAMDAVSGWVVREACRQAAEWRDRGGVAPVPISVNLDGRSVAFGDIVWTVRDAMQRVSLTPDLLRIEVKEGTFTRSDAAPSAFEALASLGVGLHLDDYGTGASSIARLRGYGVVALKIDRSFVARMHDDAASAQVVGAMVALAHNLGMKVIAEGVQTPAQFERLKELGCDYGQGFLFSRPLDPAYARALLTDDARWD